MRARTSQVLGSVVAQWPESNLARAAGCRRASARSEQPGRSGARTMWRVLCPPDHRSPAQCHVRCCGEWPIPVSSRYRRPAARRPRFARPENAAVQFRALLVTLAIAVGGALLGMVGGLLWSAVAPQAVFQVQPRRRLRRQPRDHRVHRRRRLVQPHRRRRRRDHRPGRVLRSASGATAPCPPPAPWPGPPPPRSWPGGRAATSAWPRSGTSSAAARPAPCCASPWTSAPTARSRSGRWPPGPSSAASS